jgi:hypothetical protein
MSKNPLIIPILHILKSLTEKISEYDLIRKLENNGIEFPEEESSDLALFKKHFLVMNALYQLQQDLLEDNYFLSITSLAIKIDQIEGVSDSTTLVDDTDIKLSQYYLDWKKYDQTSQSDVADLLNNFWKKYFSHDQQQQALEILGLSVESSWHEIQNTYRKKITRYHPDKGGSHARFIEIREAYEILSQFKGHYSKNKVNVNK